MWKSKKILIPAIVIVLVLIGGTAGIVLAADTPSTTQGKVIGCFGPNTDRVLAIYKEKTGVAIDKAKLQEAFDQAMKESRDKALDDTLQKRVESGQMTQDEAKKYKDWWNARPNTPMPGPFQMGPGVRGFGHMPWGRGA